MTHNHLPTQTWERAQILDALRGFALLGIALANFPEFALWTFLSPQEQAALPLSGADRGVHFLLYLLVDGKFYTIFSLLFGVGFSLILARHSRMLFLRRMLILAAIGAAHLMMLWSGDILLLYAVCGMLLIGLAPLPDKWLLRIAVGMLILPVGLDAIQELTHTDWAAPCYQAWWAEASRRGITEQNFASWLHDAHDYESIHAFLMQGAYERMWEFVGGHRVPKVIGLFLLGYLIGKHRLYNRLHELPLKRVFRISLLVGTPTSILYAWSATHGHLLGSPTLHSLLYAVSVVPLAVAYICALCLYSRSRQDPTLFAALCPAGRMALTCYLTQTLIGIALFYGVGLAWGTRLPLIMVEIIAAATFLVQVACCRLWLRYFRFGPLEWLWRMLTYGRYFPLRNNAERAQ